MRKRVSLREFQQNLTTRLGLVKRGDASRSLLGIESGDGDNAFWLIDLADSGEVVPLTELTPVPLTKSWFAGLTNVRGSLFSVVDFSAFRAGPLTPRTSQARLLMIGARHGINSALLVHRVLGLKPLEKMTRDVSVESNTAWEHQHYLDADGRQWRRLNVASLLADPTFLDVAQ
jgi:twitching motility protein PilI